MPMDEPLGPLPAEAAARTVLHLDMDAFFAAVEVLDNPTLAGKPVIVGGTPEGHGVVSTASYEARKFGVRSAMSAARAVKLCPHGIFLPPRMGRYAAVSRLVFAALGEFTPLVEPVSVDEAFLDLTGTERLHGRPIAAATAIKARVRQAPAASGPRWASPRTSSSPRWPATSRSPMGLVAVRATGRWSSSPRCRWSGSGAWAPAPPRRSTRWGSG